APRRPGARHALSGPRMWCRGGHPANRVTRSFTPVRNEADLTLKWMMADLSDHLGRLEEDSRGNREAEGLGGLEVDDQLELRGLLHGQVARRGAFEDLVHIGGGAPERVRQARAIGHEASVFHELAQLRHHREPALGRQLESPDPVRLNEKTSPHDERANARAGGGGEGALQLIGTAYLQGVQLHPQRPGGALRLPPQVYFACARWVEEDPHPRGHWHGLLQQLQPFP